MAYNETGHARNVASFEDLVIFIQSLGAAYQPASAAIQIKDLRDLQLDLRQHLQNVNDKNAIYRDKIYAKQNELEKMSNTATRILATMTGLGMDNKIINQAKSIVNKIRGGGGKKKSTTPVAAATTPETPPTESKKVSSSQMSFDQRLNNFNMLISLIASQSTYQPNEADMKVSALQNYTNTLQNLNQEATIAEQDLTIARQQRDALLYQEVKGAVVLATQVKAYIKGAFGSKSNEFKRVNGIKFTKIKSGK